jgi:hypothetical protein
VNKAKNSLKDQIIIVSERDISFEIAKVSSSSGHQAITVDGGYTSW